MNRMVSADAFRAMVSAIVERRAGVSLDDLPDVNLDDWLDDDDGIDASAAEEAAADAAAAVLEENGWEADA
jgi:uncharacterized protein YcaQ